MVKVFVKRISESTKGCQIQCTRTNGAFIEKLFELEIPEIQSGDVEIKAVSREAGYRTKIAVWSRLTDYDAVGACIGNRGMRINAILNEISGEKIDIIAYSEDPKVFIANALSPAEVVSLDINEEEKHCVAVVPDNKLSLAIGKDGQNVRLAVKLTGWRIDVKSESQINNKVEEEKSNEDEVQGISDEEIFGDIEE